MVKEMMAGLACVDIVKQMQNRYAIFRLRLMRFNWRDYDGRPKYLMRQSFSPLSDPIAFVLPDTFSDTHPTIETAQPHLSAGGLSFPRPRYEILIGRKSKRESKCFMYTDFCGKVKTTLTLGLVSQAICRLTLPAV